jgi:protein-S-isoprenylcysteine O-methyltransferase Ste14
MSPGSAVRIVWIAWIVSWWAAALWSQKAVKRPAISQEILYRVLTIAGCVLLFGFGVPPHFEVWRVGAAVAWLLVGCTAAGMLFAWWARLHIGTLWSSSVTRKAGHRVIDTGPYGIVRHPIYTGLLFSLLATAVLYGTSWAVAGAGLTIAGFYVKARVEERFLRQELGAQSYDVYARRIPMLVPGWPGGRTNG